MRTLKNDSWKWRCRFSKTTNRNSRPCTSALWFFAVLLILLTGQECGASPETPKPKPPKTRVEIAPDSKSARCNGVYAEALEDLRVARDSLEELRVDGGKLGDADGFPTINFTKLRLIIFKDIDGLTSEVLQYFGNQASVDELQFDFCSFSGGFSKTLLASFDKLKSLVLRGLDDLPRGVLCELESASLLDHVVVDSCEGVSDWILDDLAKLESVTHVGLIGINLATAKKTQWTKLNHISAWDFSFSKGIAETCLPAFDGSYAIHSLNLTAIDGLDIEKDVAKIEKLMKIVGTLVNLKSLHLDLLSVNVAALESLQPCGQLSVLSLGQCGVGDDALAALHRVGVAGRLTELYVYSCSKVSDKGVSVLRSTEVLEGIDLTGTGVTKNSLSILANITTLKWASVGHCNQLSDADIDAFINKRHDVRVVR